MRLELRELSKSHHGLTAVERLTLAVGAGRIGCLLGPSGSGKTTALRCIAGFERPDHGEILAGGERLSGPDTWVPPERRRIGMVFQDPLTSLNPLYRIGDQIVETIRAHADVTEDAARERAIALLQEAGIQGARARIDSYPHEFSGGMRQRVVLALALCAEPDLLIADEPTTALDVSIQAQIIALLKRLCRERGTAVMLITHDMGVIAEIADRVAVMYAGRIVEIGPVREVVQRPRHPYTKGLMGAIPTVATRSARLVQIPGSMPPLVAIPPGCAFHPRCSQAFDRCRRQRPERIAAGACEAACWLFAERAEAHA